MSNVSKEYVENLKKESDDRDFSKMGVTLPKGWRFVEYDEKTDQMIIKRTKNMASLKWEEGGQLSGFYITGDGEVANTDELDHSADLRRNEKGVNIFKTSKQAYASNALAMLSQQLYRANEGYEPNWRAEFTKKIVIFQHRTRVFYIKEVNIDYHFLAFKSREIAEEFLETNIDLMRQAAVFLV